MQLIATHTSDPTVTNSTDVSLDIAPVDDVDKDYVKNEVDNCPEFPNDQHDDDRDGTVTPAIRRPGLPSPSSISSPSKVQSEPGSR